MRKAVAVALVVACAEGGAAQEPPRIPASAEVVEIEAVATTSRGAFVRDLRREEFEVLEDGRPQPLTHFALRATSRANIAPPPAPAAAGPSSPAPERALRHLVFAIDDLHDPPRLTRYQADIIERGDREARRAAVAELLRADPLLPPNVAEMRVDTKARALVAETERFTALTLRTLETTVRGLGALRGRKVLVLVSDGFYLGGRFGRDDLRAITAAATRAQVVLYSLDARGLVGLTDASESGYDITGDAFRYRRIGMEADRDGLHALARDTGGLAFFNSGDLGAALRTILDDTDAYYVLGYEPVGRRDGRFHKVEVRVRRPNVQVRSRSGYFAPDDRAPARSAQGKADPRHARVQEALASLFPLRGLGVGLAGAFLETEGAGPETVVTVEIDLATVRLVQDGDTHLTVLELGGVAIDERGTVTATFGDRAELRIREAALRETVARPFAYATRLTLPPGRYQLRAAVTEGADRVGSASEWVEVPDLAKGRLAASGLFFSRDGDAAPRPLPHPRFSRVGAFEFTLVLYNAGRDAEGRSALDVATRVRHAGRELFAETTFVAEAGARVPFSRRLALATLAPGDYELHVSAQDRLSGASVTRRATFTVSE